MVRGKSGRNEKWMDGFSACTDTLAQTCTLVHTHTSTCTTMMIEIIVHAIQWYSKHSGDRLNTDIDWLFLSWISELFIHLRTNIILKEKEQKWKVIDWNRKMNVWIKLNCEEGWIAWSSMQILSFLYFCNFLHQLITALIN